MKAKNQKASKIMIGVIVVMFLFGFASIPLYRIFCTVVDPGGSAYSNEVVRAESYKGVKVDNTRTLRVRFTTNVNSQLPWQFETLVPRAEVSPGERKMVKFSARNISSKTVRGKAVYDINPPEAGKYFKKIECFCFKEQKLDPNESVTMPLVFWFEPDIPAHVKEITIAYTFFNMETSLSKATKD